MRIVYAYNEQGYFIKKVWQKIDEMTQEYPNLRLATVKEIPNYNPALERPKFTNNAWVLEGLKEKGTFYLKSDATKTTEVLNKNINLYTHIEPLPKYTDGTTQVFNDIQQNWEYTFKGKELLEVERLEKLSALKDVKIAQLQIDFNVSKKITIQNGNTLVIKHDTPERGVFLEKLINVSKESLSNGISISYQQKVDNVMYRFSILPSIWNYIFKDLFLLDRKKSDGTSTGIKESSREHNKIMFDAIVLKIQNATTEDELNIITWNFANPDGILININEKAEQMLNDPIVDNFTKSAINQLKDPITGEIHLIKIV